MFMIKDTEWDKRMSVIKNQNYISQVSLAAINQAHMRITGKSIEQVPVAT